MTTRRNFLRQAGATALAFSAFETLRGQAAAQMYAIDPERGIDPLGQLVRDPAGILRLPQGFSYKIVATSGETMGDGLIRPGAPDGMAAFEDEGDPDRVILVCNHELDLDDADVSAFTGPAGVPEGLADKAWGLQPDGQPIAGGTTTLHYSRAAGAVTHQFLSLTGTVRNCAGGRTPWGSWLSCEETLVDERAGSTRAHGFAFEVPASATGPVDAVPLKAMGRFVREAVAVDPGTGIVYMTEDQGDGLLYRFIPDVPGDLARGGRLQALGLVGKGHVDTGNRQGSGMLFAEGEAHAVRWVDLDNPEAPDGDLAERGRAAGAVSFVRGEGIDFGLDHEGRAVIYFAATSGGAAGLGQIWTYRPGANEGREAPGGTAGMLSLLYESSHRSAMEACDNVVVAPWGDLIVCEDSYDDNPVTRNYLRGITPEGKIYTLAMNEHADNGEFCGACFSPDGEILFVNIQRPGYTIAVTGPWEKLRSV